MFRRIGILAIVILLGLIAAQALTQSPQKTANMTDQELKEKIDSLAKLEQPLSAAKFIAEAKKRAKATHDTPWMLDIINTEIELNSRRLARSSSVEEEYEKAIKDAWTPLTHALRFAQFTHTGNNSFLAPLLAEADQLFNFSAKEIGAENRWMASRNALDYIATHIAVSYSSDDSQKAQAVDILERQAKAHSDTTSQIIASALRVIINSDESLQEALTDSLLAIPATSPEQKAIVNFVRALQIIDTVNLTPAHPTDEQIAQADKLISEAKSLFTYVVNNLPKTIFSLKAKQTIKKIDAPYLNIQSDTQIIPGAYTPVYLEYRNVKDIEIRLYQVDNKEIEHSSDINTYDLEEYLKTIHCSVSRKLTLPVTNHSLKNTSTYVEMEGMKPGLVAIAAFHNDSLIDCHFSLCSQIAVNQVDAQLLISDFQTGRPLTKACVGGKMHTDADGWTQPIMGSNEDFTVTLGNNDKFTFNWYGHSRNRFVNRVQSARVLTDRNIYRPGQKISFKAFVFTSYIDHIAPEENEDYELILSAANGKVIAKQSITTDALGTAWGEIVIPADAFKGRASLQISNKRSSLCWQSIQIEDFKRTDNSLKIDPFTEAYLPGATVSVTGSGSSAAGLPVANAAVEYTINRQGSVIANGTTTTDDNGQFSFTFKTSNDKQDATYSIEVRMTDLKGETVTEQRNCHILKTGTNIRLALKKGMAVTGQSLPITLNSINSNDEPFAAKLHLSVTPFAPSDPLKPRAEHYSDTTLSPNASVVWDSPNNAASLSDKPCAERDFDVNGSLTFDLKELSLAPGKYSIRLTATALDGSELHNEVEATVIATDGASPNLDYLDIFAPETANSGDTLTVKLCSGIQDALVNVVIAHRGKIVARKAVNVSCGVANVCYNIPADAINGETLAIHAFTTKDGRHYHQERQITLHHQERQIALTLNTFRDHSRPGAHETWTLSTDSKAVVVASMYDSRLDKYISNKWEPRINRTSIPNYIFHNSFSPEIYPHTYPLYDTNAYLNSAEIIESTFCELVDAKRSWRTMKEEAICYESACFARNKSLSPRMAVSIGMNDLAEAESMVSEDNDGDSGGETSSTDTSSVTPRENFAETVFFMPCLTPDTNGNVTLSFSLPDNLTTYNFRALAHDAELHVAMATQTLTVNKPLNVRMGAPRFLTEQDVINFAADISAADTSIAHATASISVTDPATGRQVVALPDVELSFANAISQQTAWQFEVPLGVDSLQIDIVAKTEGASDGERRIIPVVKRYDEVAESHSFALVNKGDNKLKNPFAEEHTTCLTFSYTSNAFIEVLRALPTLDKDWYPSTDTYLGRFETAAIASMLSKKPEIKKAVDYLAKNVAKDDAPLQIADAEHTPWFYMALRLRQHDKDVVKLMDTNRTNRVKASSLAKLAKMQLSDGSFPWFNGMDGSAWMTAGVVSTIGEMIHLGVIKGDEPHVSQICKRAIPYLDNVIKGYHNPKGSSNAWCPLELLYARILVSPNLSKEETALVDSLAAHWQMPSMVDRVTAATILTLAGRKADAMTIVKSLEENLVQTNDGTAYIPEEGLFRRRAQVEAQAMLIMTLQRLNPKSPNLPKIINHLILMKRGEAWPDAQSTSRAVLALLGSSASVASTDVVTVADTTVTLTPSNPKTELSIPVNTRTATVNKSNDVTSWGSWSRVALLAKDQMPAYGTDKLKISRTIEVRRVVGNNVQWMPLDTVATPLAIGDQIRVTLKFYNDEPLSFVRISDFRAAALEPDDKLSGYRGWWWWARTSADIPTPPHYMSIADNSVDFFIDYLNDGWHQLSYTLTLANKGRFAAGYADATCLYETEIKAHTEGRRLEVVK